MLVKIIWSNCVGS